MNIIIAGSGKIGATLISSLVAEGHDVVVVDRNPDVIAEITNIYDVMGVCGNCADTDVLEEAGAKDAELIIAAAGSDELNMLCCFLAKKMGTKHTIARIRTPEYNDEDLGFLKQELNLSETLNPEYLAAHEIYDILHFPSAIKVETFSNQTLKIVNLIIKDNSVVEQL